MKLKSSGVLAIPSKKLKIYTMHSATVHGKATTVKVVSDFRGQSSSQLPSTGGGSRVAQGINSIV
jgi:hypothetical protein